LDFVLSIGNSQVEFPSVPSIALSKRFSLPDVLAGVQDDLDLTPRDIPHREDSFESISTLGSIASEEQTCMISTAATSRRESASSDALRIISPSGRCDRLSKYVNEEVAKTTIMIRNIPCRCTQDELLEEIEDVVPGVDFLYLPKSHKREGNLGYAFANFVEPRLAVEFLDRFQGSPFAKHPRSAKRAEVGYALLQGFRENVKFYRRSKVAKSEHRPFVMKKQKLSVV
jgi:hypothetical protein